MEQTHWLRRVWRLAEVGGGRTRATSRTSTSQRGAGWECPNAREKHAARFLALSAGGLQAWRPGLMTNAGRTGIDTLA